MLTGFLRKRGRLGEEGGLDRAWHKSDPGNFETEQCQILRSVRWSTITDMVTRKMR